MIVPGLFVCYPESDMVGIPRSASSHRCFRLPLCSASEETTLTREAAVDGRIGSIRIGPDDPRYLAVVDKRFNKRYRASPDYFRLVSSTDQVVSAVEEGVRDGRRLAVRRG